MFLPSLAIKPAAASPRRAEFHDYNSHRWCKIRRQWRKDPSTNAFFYCSYNVLCFNSIMLSSFD